MGILKHHCSMAQVSTLHVLTEMTATSSSSYLPVMVIQLMKERERRFHILPPGVRSVGQVAHIAQGSAASLLSGTLEPLWPLASVMPTPAPGVDCPLQAGGHETRGRAQPQHTGSRGPEDGWRGRGHSAVWPASGPWSNMSPDPPQPPHRQDGSSHCLMVKHLFAGCILARPRVCCDRMKARAEVNN